MVDGTSFLSAQHYATLSTLVKNENVSFKTVGKTYDIFVGEELNLVLSIHDLFENARINEHDVEGHVRGLISVYLLHLVIEQSKEKDTGSMASPVTAAKATTYRILQHMELNLREDSKRAEQWRMRANAKEGTVKVSKTAGKDAGLADAMRFRMATKAFAFSCMVGKPDIDATPLKLMCATQNDIDAQLEKLSQQYAQELKDALRDFGVAAESEVLLGYASIGSKSARRPPYHNESLELSSCPSFHLLGHTGSNFSTHQGEYRHLLAPHLSSVVMLDTDPLSKEWSTTRDIVRAAANGAISQAQQQQLINTLSSGTVSPQVLGLSPPLYVSIAENNPNLAAQILSSLGSPSYAMAAISSEKVDISAMNSIMAQSVGTLKQNLLSKYVSGVMKKLETTSDKTAAVKQFAVTLNNLVTKKPDLFVAADKVAAGIVFKEYSSLPEVQEHWSSLVQ